MKILPSTTELSTTPIARRHSPPAGKFPTYRACLRWEFGFSCAFCLLHEADFVAGGIDGTGLTSVEHQIPRSHAPQLEDEYDNCIYACRFCNGARGDTPNVDVAGRTLLDPCTSAWASHFKREGFSLAPLGDDAEYTAQTYDLDDPRKVEFRRARTGAITSGLRMLREGPERVVKLLDAAVNAREQDRDVLVATAHDLRGFILTAAKTLARYRIVPLDAPVSCRCGAAFVREAPRFMVAQCLDLEDR